VTEGSDVEVRPEGWTIRRFDTIDSTNRWVLDQARAGAPERLVAVADHQEAGRGRRGRTWQARPGSSLLLSVLLRPRLTSERVHLLTMAAGLALAEALRGAASIEASLKWPNDVVVGDRKVAGLLAEAEMSSAGAVSTVVIGVGCNVTQREFPDELAATATSCAIEAGRAVDREAVLVAFLGRLDGHLARLDEVADAYRSRLATLGRDVRVDLGNAVIEGRAVDVDSLGRLVLDRDDGVRATVAVGDVVHLRPV
jgi:BirA family biotin operon repressor/biotin-[acetyl-CoA-carboxylase] ligase